MTDKWTQSHEVQKATVTYAANGKDIELREYAGSIQESKVKQRSRLNRWARKKIRAEGQRNQDQSEKTEQSEILRIRICEVELICNQKESFAGGRNNSVYRRINGNILNREDSYWQ